MQPDEDLRRFFDVDERREEARLNLGASIYIEVESSEPGANQKPKVTTCEALDMSANGLQVLVDLELQAGAIHTLIVDVDSSDERYRLSAEVKWVRGHHEGYLVGLALYDSDGTEIIDWKLMVAKFLN